MVKSSTGEAGRRNNQNEKRLVRWVKKQQKENPGLRFKVSEKFFELKLTRNYMGNTLKWLPGVRKLKQKPGENKSALWEILPEKVERND